MFKVHFNILLKRSAGTFSREIFFQKKKELAAARSINRKSLLFRNIMCQDSEHSLLKALNMLRYLSSKSAHVSGYCPFNFTENFL